MGTDLKIFYLNNIEAGFDLLLDLLECGIYIDHVITLHPVDAKKYNISGYFDYKEMKDYTDTKIYYPEEFNLSGKLDLEFFQKEKPDLLLCLGWQRLIPAEIIESCKWGAWGCHGSSEPLPKGRGRSPINWSLIENKKKFILHLFWLKADADSGNIIDTMEFDINPFDTCKTLYHKVSVCLSRLVKYYIENFWEIVDYPQRSDGVTYYPKRTPDDGYIKWKDMTTEEIYNLVRAVTKPYPGAFSFNSENGKKIMIWKCQPFDTRITYYDKENGEIVEKFSDGNFVVKTRDSSILITEYDGDVEKHGMLF